MQTLVTVLHTSGYSADQRVMQYQNTFIIKASLSLRIHQDLEFINSTQRSIIYSTVLPAKSDSDVKFCLQSYQGLKIDRSLVYESYTQVIY